MIGRKAMICNIKKITNVDFKIDSIFSELSFLKNEYPDFYVWFYDKVVSGLSDNSRQIFLASTPLSFGKVNGVLILKNTDFEKKICTLYVNKESRMNGIGQKFMDIAFNELNTDKPLITVSDARLKEFDRLLNKFNFESVDALPDYYAYNHTEYTFNGHLYLPESIKYA